MLIILKTKIIRYSSTYSLKLLRFIAVVGAGLEGPNPVFRIRIQLNPNPDPDKNPDPKDPDTLNPVPDPSYFLTLSENNIKLFHNKILSSKEVN